MTEPNRQTPPQQPLPLVVAQQPVADPAPEHPSSAAPGVRRHSIRGSALATVAVLLAFGAGTAVGNVAGPNSSPDTPAAATSASAAPSSTTAGAAAPTTATPTLASAPRTPATTAAPKPASYRKLSERQWKLVAKNPDAHLHKTYLIYGTVTQFDSATGTDTFRANVAHKRMAEEWDYPTNTMLTGPESALDDLVEDDVFQAKVTVLGSLSYDTQIGGETTVPLLRIDSIKLL